MFFLYKISFRSFFLFSFYASIVCALVTTSGFWFVLNEEQWLIWITSVSSMGFLLYGCDPALIFLTLLGLWNLLRIIDVKDVLFGFSNASLATVVLLFWVSRLIQKLDVLKDVFVVLLGKGHSLFILLMRLMPVVMILSAFINNTPIVLLLIPLLEWWTIQQKISLSKVLMPLSFASMVGGMCTLIGTSTNLIVQEQIRNLDPSSTFGFFEPGIVGFPLCLLTIIYLSLCSKWMLPKKTFQRRYLSRHYAIFQCPKENSFEVGQRIENTPGLRRIKEIHGEDQEYLVLLGIVPQIEHLLASRFVASHVSLLSSIEIKALFSQQHFFELSLLNVPEADSLSKYPTFVVHRKGKVLEDPVQKIFDEEEGVVRYLCTFSTPIQAQDLLLVESSYELYFEAKEWTSDIVEVPLYSAPQHSARHSSRNGCFRPWIWLLFLSLGFCLLTVFFVCGISDLLSSSFFFFLILFLLLRRQDPTLWKHLLSQSNWSIFLILASSMSLGHSIQETGVSKEIALRISELFVPGGFLGTTAGLFLLTSLLTNFINNAAVVSFMIPIAYDISLTTGFEAKALYFCVMIAGSSAFLIPWGYQTNLIVQDATGYRWRDFLVLGLGMTILSFTVTVTMVFVLYGW
jgi:di/tricarboxylate transporter